MNYLFASTNFGTEKLLEKELLFLGAKILNIKNGGIYFQGNDILLYKSLMWSRIASRIFICIKKFHIDNIDDLYRNVYSINWSEIFDVNNTFLVNFKGTNDIIRNSLFGALKIKDAIVDQFKKKYSFRPNINLTKPDIRIRSFLFNYTIHIMLDLSGESLYKREYRKFCHITPIKENLAAAIVLSSQWDKSIPMIDPMCGSGTLLIEAAMIASDRAPGLTRSQWGFKSWKKYNKKLWEETLKEAKARFEIGIKKCFKSYFIGYDYNPEIIKKARINASNAGLLNIIQFFTQDLNDLKNTYNKKEVGILLSNPPYGERHQTENQLVGVYIQLGVISKKYFTNWKLSVFSSSTFLLNFLQMHAHEEFFFKNGALNCIQKNYRICTQSSNIENNEYKDRLKKNVKKLKKWTNLEQIECFRVYNADLPNYNIIVDVYNKWIVIQEYKAPKLINYKKAFKRLCHAIYHTKEILAISINNIILKIRHKNKNKTQYNKLFNSDSFFIIKEYHAKFLVNIIDYLDTGLFSDKRMIRKLLGEMSKGKDFLNLFSYTGTASVYAGLGGANSTTSVDMSNTYIKWSMQNMSINHLTSSKHNFIQSDCLNWIKETKQQFDLIFINPPTFSNSKKMRQSFDLKRDYLDIMIYLKKILRDNGSIIFSSSTRNFKINIDYLRKMQLNSKNITKKTQSKDYLKDSNIYHSWLITHIQ
ncbi:bifunctional 23S rRNA (guanine(2069)-N(7))-methyltransferase RlmK/23S rRNA (guanine(2445)-N(2))-methyltransferase RlmL [Buchnera aphidicola (Hyperomyzus lactucae)]|uniref:Ribosomal RNA large subunit methyltransferase K/L n=1 Tax=Buchnera aphidicola (Hyperomyzus lactucae) TaxID=1241860 RepID=A0A4D6XTP7_9GAMM|nr:bifunctional 23S rRNA (guanine(2069)-N(7))-methyltransferase RlmK/23S rRNA (guanine(2445)-N(2))-methyltransferase RlmL [Buchnera aphidicola]QCI21082.1 bifunctional 23S rRNA (guanine(2069)-N(7))-methyltransferase RlmK/23S rRNA (guanine(2445)-N(2))-methyltransferase RlmL [Buchnera aphidicola (Hyperomyzus lactucae)]